MTPDVPSAYNDAKVPMLDVKVWLEAEDHFNVHYMFYEKPTKNRYVISKESAMPLSQKINILSQEVFRRLHNTKHSISWDVKSEILEIWGSGYLEFDRFQILSSGINRYNKLRKKKVEERDHSTGTEIMKEIVEMKRKDQEEEAGSKLKTINTQLYFLYLPHQIVNCSKCYKELKRSI